MRKLAYSGSEMLADLLSAGGAGAGRALATIRSPEVQTRVDDLREAHRAFRNEEATNPKFLADIRRRVPGVFDGPVAITRHPASGERVVVAPGADGTPDMYPNLEPALLGDEEAALKGEGGAIAPYAGRFLEGGSLIGNAATAPGGHTLLSPLLSLAGSVGATALMNKLAPNMRNNMYAQGGAAALGTLGARLGLRAYDSMTQPSAPPPLRIPPPERPRQAEAQFQRPPPDMAQYPEQQGASIGQPPTPQALSYF